MTVFGRTMRFDPTINLGHIFSAITFIGVGVALYVAMVVDIESLRAFEEKRPIYDQAVADMALQAQRIDASERLLAEQKETNRQMLEKLSELNTNVAVLRVKLEEGLPSP